MVLDTDSIGEIRCIVRHWVKALAEGRFDDAASAMTTAESHCSPGTLRDAIGNYSRRYREALATEKEKFLPKITSPFDIDSRGENFVTYWKDGAVQVEYDLPIEGAWSDLTARFRLTRNPDGRFSLSLADIRVL